MQKLGMRKVTLGQVNAKGEFTDSFYEGEFNNLTDAIKEARHIASNYNATAFFTTTVAIGVFAFAEDIRKPAREIVVFPIHSTV